MNSTCATDEDEEFLKSNETMKDLTPPKLTPAVQSPSLSGNSTTAKQLYAVASSPPNLKPEPKANIKLEVKSESSDPQQRNGLIVPSSNDSKAGMCFPFFSGKLMFSLSSNSTSTAMIHFLRFILNFLFIISQ